MTGPAIGYLVPTATAYPGATFFPNVSQTAVPFVNPTAGVFVFSEGGVLKAFLPGGVVVPLTTATGGLYVKKNAVQDAVTDYAAFGATPPASGAVRVDAVSFSDIALHVSRGATSIGTLISTGATNLQLIGAAGVNLHLGTNASSKWYVLSEAAGTASFVANQPTARWIGAATANQIRDAANANNNASWTDAGVWNFRSTVNAPQFSADPAGYFRWSTRAHMRSPALGEIDFRDNAETGFSTWRRGVSGGATSIVEQQKTVTAIADATPTNVLTVTIPNSVQTGTLRVTLDGALGAGGAIGADEATGSVTYDIAIARTPGVNAVAVASAAYGATSAAVAGATTITVTAAVSAIAGAVGDPNTFTVQVTITAGAAGPTNHTCMILAQLLNGRASGLTIA